MGQEAVAHRQAREEQRERGQQRRRAVDGRGEQRMVDTAVVRARVRVQHVELAAHVVPCLRPGNIAWQSSREDGGCRAEHALAARARQRSNVQVVAVGAVGPHARDATAGPAVTGGQEHAAAPHVARHCAVREGYDERQVVGEQAEGGQGGGGGRHLERVARGQQRALVRKQRAHEHVHTALVQRDVVVEEEEEGCGGGRSVDARQLVVNLLAASRCSPGNRHRCAAVGSGNTGAELERCGVLRRREAARSGQHGSRTAGSAADSTANTK